MIDMRPILFATTLVASLAGCGGPAGTPNPAPQSIAAKPDVTITVDGARHACVVALSRESQGSIIACGDVVPFVRDELRLPSGSTCDIRSGPGVDEADLKSVGGRLKEAGYRVAQART
jgi:hypothetical protein